jgi:hypothetical protein
MPLFNPPPITASGFTLQDGANVILGTTTGTKLGTGATQKIGLYDATPVVQAAAIAAPAGGVIIDEEARAAIDFIRTALSGVGITAT